MKKLFFCLVLMLSFLSVFSANYDSALYDLSKVNEISQQKKIWCYTNSSVEMFKKPDSTSKSVKMLFFGEKIELCSIEGTWCKVKLSDGKRGYVPSATLLMDKDYNLLHSCVEDITGSKKKVLFLYPQLPMAILDFLKIHHWEGNVHWKLLIPMNVNCFSNSVLYCVGKNEHYKDIAFILTNIVTQEQVLAIYTFDDLGNPILALQTKAPERVVLSRFNYNNQTNRYAVNFVQPANSYFELCILTGTEDFSSYFSTKPDANLNEQKDCRPAQFPGGTKALLKYITSHFVYHAISIKQGLEGTIKVRFRIEQDGSIGEVQIINGLSPEMDTEAIRVVKTLPRFLPAFAQGKSVPVWMSVPISFVLK